MKQRISYLIKLFLAFLLFFVLQKIVFVYLNEPLPAGDLFQVIVHGLGLDASTTGYLLIFPFLVVWLSIWMRRMKTKAVLRPYFILIAILLSLICVADTSLYTFWKFKLDATIFNYMDAPKQAMASVSTGYVVMRLLWITVFSVLLSWTCTRLTPKTFPVLPINLKMLLHNFTYVLLGGLIFLAIRGGIGRSTMNIGNAYFSENTYMNHAAVNPAFSLMYSWNKSENFAEKYNYLDEHKRAACYAPLYPASTEDCTRQLLRATRPNILIIILEGFGGEYIEELGGAKNVSPNISRLIREGIFFDNVYANSFRTDRGLVSTLSGHISYPTTSIMKLPAKSRNLPSVARSLAGEGYKTSFAYGGDLNFTNQASYMYATGWQELIWQKDLRFDAPASDWGYDDRLMCDWFADRVIALSESREPFLAGLLTLSSHTPFDVPYAKFDDRVLNAMAFSDDCVGKMIDRLKASPAWENLLVVLVADHGYPYPRTLAYNEPLRHRIPMIWTGGAVARPRVVEDYASQIDIAATLLAQLGVPHDDFDYSKDIFAPTPPRKFAYYAFNDGFGVVDASGEAVWDATSGKAVRETNPELLDVGRTMLQTTYVDIGRR